MEKSDSIKHLAAALNKAQEAMGSAKKSADNPFFKSKYSDLSEVVKAIKEPFSENGLSYTQFPIEDNGRIGVETILMHDSGEYISNQFTVNLTKQDAQQAGSAITYCRRYALQAIAGIPSEDDDGNAATHHPHAQEKPWYNKPEFERDRVMMIEAIKNGMSIDDVISNLKQNNKLGKETEEHIRVELSEDTE